MIVTIASLALASIMAAPDPVAEILDRAIAARGELEVKGEHAIRFSGTFTQDGTTVTFVRTIREPSCLREERQWVYQGEKASQIMVVNGKQGWTKHSHGGATADAPPFAITAIAEAAYRAEVGRFVALKDAARFKVLLRPDEPVDGDMCHVIRVQSDGREDVNLFISKQSSRLRMVVTKRTGADGQMVDSIEVLSKHKKFSGLSIPTVVQKKIGGVPEVHETIDKVDILPVKEVSHSFDRP